MATPYEGPANVTITPSEVDALLDLLNANPRLWNKALRDRLTHYVERYTEK